MPKKKRKKPSSHTYVQNRQNLLKIRQAQLSYHTNPVHSSAPQPAINAGDSSEEQTLLNVVNKSTLSFSYSDL